MPSPPKGEADEGLLPAKRVGDGGPTTCGAARAHHWTRASTLTSISNTRVSVGVGYEQRPKQVRSVPGNMSQNFSTKILVNQRSGKGKPKVLGTAPVSAPRYGHQHGGAARVRRWTRVSTLTRASTTIGLGSEA